MERIKEAVMRARAQREKEGAMVPASDAVEPQPAESSGAPSTAPAVPAAPVAPATQDASSPPPAAPDTPAASTSPAAPAAPAQGGGALTAGNIEYRQTKVVHLDPSHLEKNRIISFRKTDERTVSFDRLRTVIMRTMKDNGWRTLAVTSPTASCGKTTVALNLALSIAHQTEQTVLLADFDLRDPNIAEYLGLPESPSLVDYLSDQVSLPEVFVNPGIPRLTLLPNHKAILNSAETMMTSKMHNMVSEIRNRYDTRLVIFDLPPMLTTDDALAFLPQVDCALVVLASGQSTKSQVKETMALLQTTNVVGTVLNKGD